MPGSPYSKCHQRSHQLKDRCEKAPREKKSDSPPPPAKIDSRMIHPAPTKPRPIPPPSLQTITKTTIAAAPHSAVQAQATRYRPGHRTRAPPPLASTLHFRSRRRPVPHQHHRAAPPNRRRADTTPEAAPYLRRAARPSTHALLFHLRRLAGWTVVF